jgi:hypothetical protein
VVVHLLCDRPKPCDRYAAALLNCQRVIGSFQFNQWPQSDLTSVYRRL